MIKILQASFSSSKRNDETMQGVFSIHSICKSNRRDIKIYVKLQQNKTESIENCCEWKKEWPLVAIKFRFKLDGFIYIMLF